MTEYICTAVVNEQKYEFITCAAVTIPQAYEQFDNFLIEEHSAVIELATSLKFKRIKN
jgi:hypothetical protein